MLDQDQWTICIQLCRDMSVQSIFARSLRADMLWRPYGVKSIHDFCRC